MVLVGRITKDAVVNQLKDEREVVNFSIALNDYYKPKGATEPTKATTFVNCSYWISSKLAPGLKKGTLVELTGRISVEVYTDMNGNAKGSLKCHVNNIKIHSTAKEGEVPPASKPQTLTAEQRDDLPF
jgi:single-strand DNA-binding protein